MDWGESKTIHTPEQVSLTYTLAGLGTRFAAMVVDTCLQGLVLLAVAIIFGELDALSALDTKLSSAAPWIAALQTLGFFLVLWGYFIFWESVWGGQTPGKYLCGVRVLRDGGFPIDFRAAFLRNIARFVDFLAAFYGAGALTMFLSKDSKRLGDYAAGTIVVVNPRRARHVAPPAPAAEPSYSLLGDPSLLNLRAVTREQFLVIERFLSRREELPEKVRTQLGLQLAKPLFPLLGMQTPIPPYPYEQFLLQFAEAYRRRPGA